MRRRNGDSHPGHGNQKKSNVEGDVLGASLVMSIGSQRAIKFTGPEDRIVRVNNKVNDRVNVHVNDRENTLLSYLAQDPGYTVTQLAVMMSVSRKTIAGYLKNLKEKGAIERIGTTRTGYWKIK